ncbi:YcxB family protein [Psychromonas sp. KJ10-10]|uniref:YcxB family protein n=1 Tax=Psychromonas sp. KJ10-10 TaxID=3391823 RepID=UPI0039B4E86C
MQFSNHYVLDREYFSECFEQSTLQQPVKKMRYKFIGSLLLFGFAIMILTELSVAVGFFFIGLAFVEFFSFKYRKAWWISRQMWSKNSGNKINLIINEQSIQIESLYQNKNLPWLDMKSLIETPKGLIFILQTGEQTYLSKACLNTEVVDFIKSKITTTTLMND